MKTFDCTDFNLISALLLSIFTGLQAAIVCLLVWREFVDTNQQTTPGQTRDQVSHAVALADQLHAIRHGQLDETGRRDSHRKRQKIWPEKLDTNI